MSWNFTGRIFGRDANFEIETITPFHDVYRILLIVNWQYRKHFKKVNDKSFVEFALHFLPEDSYVVFDFNESDLFYVQFCRLENYIFMDIPFGWDNIYTFRKTEMDEILRSYKFTKQRSKDPVAKVNTYFDIPVEQDKISRRVCFGKDYSKAIEVIKLIAKGIFKLKTPTISTYGIGQFNTYLSTKAT